MGAENEALVGTVTDGKSDFFGLRFFGRGLGLRLFVGLRDVDLPELRVNLDAYRQAWREAGHAGNGDVCLRIPVYAAPTEKEALEEPRENITYFFERHQDLTRTRLGRNDTGPLDRHEARLAKLKAMDYDEILEKRVAFGTAEQLKERLGELTSSLGLDGFIVELNPGGLLPMDRMLRTLRILTHEVLPALR